MLSIKIKSKSENKEFLFDIKIPYVIVRSVAWLATSPLLWKYVNSTITYRVGDTEVTKYIPLHIDREGVRELLNEIMKYKGLTIVDVKATDGTEVIVRL